MAPASVLARLPEGAGCLAAIITFRYHRQRALDHRRSGEADHDGVLGALFDHLDMDAGPLPRPATPNSQWLGWPGGGVGRGR